MTQAKQVISLSFKLISLWFKRFNSDSLTGGDRPSRWISLALTMWR